MFLIIPYAGSSHMDILEVLYKANVYLGPYTCMIDAQFGWKYD